MPFYLKMALRQLLLFLVLVTGLKNSLFAQQDTTGNRGLKNIKSAPTEWGTTYALIIGISNYKNITQLNYADDDAEAFRDFLLDTKIVTDPNNIYYLIDSTATKTEIFKGLNNIYSKVKGENNERVFIYFAGHGDTEAETEQGYLLAYNCEKVAYDMTDAVYLPQFEPKVAAIAKKAKVFLITDACRSGNLAGQNNGALRTMKAINDGFVNTIKILSCEPGQLSQEKPFPGGGHGVFTYYLLDALYGLTVSDTVNYIEVNDIKSYLSEKVYKNTNKEQSPMVIGSSSEIIAKVNPEMKQAVIARKKMAAENPNYIAKRRDNSNSLKISADDSVYYKQFYDHLRAGRLNMPFGNNAWESYKKARNTIKNEGLINLMKFDLAAKLEDAVQPLLNRFIRAEFQDYPDSLFNDADNKLKIVMDELMDTSDIRINEIKAKRIFFIASIHKTPRALELLRTADALMPNSTFISFEIGRYFSEISKQTDSALVYLNKAIRLSPRWSYPRFMIGNIYYRNKEYSRAKDFYANAIELQPKFAYALFNQALTFKQMKQKDSADYYYQKAILLDNIFEQQWGGERKTENNIDIVSLGKAVRNSERTDEKMFEGLLPPASKYNSTEISVEASNGYQYYSKAYYFSKDRNDDSALYYYNKAADMFEQAHDKGNLPLNYYYTWGYTQQSLNNNKKAEDIYQLGLKKDTTDFHLYYFGIGWTKDKQNDFEGALNWYKKAAENNPLYYQAFNNIGWTFNKLNKKDSAIYYYKKALQVNPDYLTSLYNVADAYYLGLVDDSAIYYYKKIARLLTTSDDNLFYRIGVSYDYLRKYDSAIAYFSKAIEINTNISYYYKDIALIYFNTAKYEKAIVNYEKANSLTTSGVKTYINLALSYIYLGDYDKGEKLLLDGIKNDTTTKNLYLYYYNIGWVNDKQKKFKEAIYWYSKSAMQNPGYVNAFNNTGYAYDRVGNSDSAIYWYKQAIKIDPTYTRAMFNLASLYNDIYKYDSALYYYKMIFPLAPRDANISYEIALLYYYNAVYDSSVIYFERATALNNKKADYHAKAADAYFDAAPYYKDKESIYKKAIEHYSAALRLDSTQFLAMNRLGVAYIYLGMFKEGIEVFELALQKDAVYKNTYEYNLACIYSLQKNADKALSYFDRSINSGYRDLAHISEDTDLDNIRRLPGFKAIIEKYFLPSELVKQPNLFGKQN